MWRAELSDLITDETRRADAWHALRAYRDQMLLACDWTQVSDAPVDQTAWAIYRQALRDLPETTTDPFNPIWPTPPDQTGVAT